ncbi:MAG: RNA-binding S4 domain-containing protein [Bacteroides sp.]|nr:RNA-binding S4 domain-containing protein [Bacteroidaceae bacterium]MBP3670210.1 RNA-binding S4 domain-containing protein [Bacteroides sp.]
MMNENEGRFEGSANENREGGYNRNYNREYTNYNRYNNDGESRPYRPRTNNYNQGGERVYRSSYQGGYGEQRPQRPRFNSEGGEQRSYRPRTNSYNQGGYGEQRPQRPRFNSEGGEQRSYRPRTNSYNQGGYGEQRPQRPRFNAEGGEQRPFRPRTNSFNQGGYGDQRPQRPARPQRPRTNGYNPNAKYSHKKQIEYKDILTDPNEPIRLNKFLANAGICSRREADEFITAGVVTVNGEVVTELGTKIKRTDEVKFHDQPVNIERKVYVLLNKPKDCVTTSDDPQARKTVMDYVKDACKERIYPVGRLDRNTTGVLLLTNDGDLASKLTHPKFLKKKIYHVYCDKNVTKADLDQIAAGITLDDGEIHADAISYASETDKKQVGIEIHSGKNRIVRRIFESLGYKVSKLDRVYFAGLTKKGLKRGDWRYLTELEVNMLRMGSFE